MGSAATTFGDFEKFSNPHAPLVFVAGGLTTMPLWLPTLRQVSETTAELAPIVGVLIGLVTLWKTARRGDAKKTEKHKAEVRKTLKEHAMAFSVRGGPIAVAALLVLAVAAVATHWIKPRRDMPAALGFMSTATASPRKRAKDDAGEDGEAEPMAIEGAPPWFELLHAKIGTHEGTKRKPNKFVSELFESAGFAYYKDQSAVAWCSIGSCGALELCGVPSAKTAMARENLKWGVKLDEPRLGCLVVIWRVSPKSHLGHVGFYAGETATHIKILGCNQSDKISIALFPKNRLLGYRWPRAVHQLRTVKGSAIGALASIGAAGASGVAVVEDMTAPVRPVQQSLEQLGTPWGLKMAAYIALACALVGIGATLYTAWRRMKDHAERGL